MADTTSSQHYGRVVKLDGDAAIVRFQRSKMCAHCGGCLAMGEKEMETRVPNTLHAQTGDLVEVAITPGRVVRASLLAYCIPLAALLAGVALGSLISELAAVGIGLLLCLSSFLLLHVLNAGFQAKRTFEPMMIQIVDENTNGRCAE